MPLDPAVRAVLEREAGPPRSERTIAQTREMYLAARAASGPPVPLQKIEDIEADGVPVRVYEPAPGAPVLVYFHGGRFISGNLETHDAVCRSLAAQSGCAVAAVDYRLAPEHRFPAAIEDCFAALRWFANRGIAAVGGDSAGGGLAAAAALMARGEFEVAGQMLIYPMLDATCSMASHTEFASGYGPGSADMQRGYDEYLAGAADLKDPRVSPLFAPDLRGLPPAFVLTVEYDSLRDEGEAYARRLQSAGVPVRAVRVDGAIHGIFQMAGVLDCGAAAVRNAAEWLRETFSMEKSL